MSGVRGAGVIEPRGARSKIRSTGSVAIIAISTRRTEGRGSGCKTACEGDKRCRAWTYVRPGYSGAAARCYFKKRITAAAMKPCCISGVVR